MPKIEIEKSTWLEEARSDYAQGGFWNGTYMVHLTFKGGSCPDNEYLAKLLSKIGEQKLPKRRIVRLTGLFSSTDSDIGKLVLMLHDYGYMLQIVLKDIPDLTWLPYCNWLIYRTATPMVPVAFDELWYEPPEVADIIEPVLPKPMLDRQSGIMKPQFLYLKRAGNVSIVTKFVCDSQKNWQLL
jgi:hypothetical protein